MYFYYYFCIQLLRLTFFSLYIEYCKQINFLVLSLMSYLYIKLLMDTYLNTSFIYKMD